MRAFSVVSGWLAASGPWLVAVLAAAAAVSVFWPGMLSHDAASMWWQARGGAMDTVHSPLFVYEWRGLERFIDSPAPVFVLHLAVFWTGLALLAQRLPVAPGLRVLAMLVCGLAPPLWVVMAQTGTDAAMIASMTLAAACMVRARLDRDRRWLAVMMVALMHASAMRHNAWPAALPLLWAASPVMPAGTAWRRAGLAMAALLAILAATWAVNASVPRQRAVWPATAMWDLAAVSIAENKVLLPAATVGPGMQPQDLSQAFEPWTNTTLFARTHAGVRQPFFTPAQQALKRQVARAWLDAVIAHPGAYLRHRLRLARGLFGTHPADWPVQLIYFPSPVQLDHNPPLARRTDAWHRLWMNGLQRWRRGPLLAAWPWLVLGLVPLLALAWRGSRSALGVPVLGLLASGACVAVPLVLAAPAAELRYLGWPIAATLQALVLALAAVRVADPPRARHVHAATAVDPGRPC